MRNTIHHNKEAEFCTKNFGLKLMVLTILLLFTFSMQGIAAPLKQGMAKGKGGPLEQEIKDQEKKSHKKKPKFKEGELIVKFKKDVPDKAKDKVHNKHGSKKVKTFGKLRIHHIKLPKGLSVEDAIEKYKSDPNVEYAEPNFGYDIYNTPNDPLFGELWSFYNNGKELAISKRGSDITAIKAWDIATGDSSVVVAIIDSGIDYTHEDLADNIWINETEYYGFSGFDDDGNGYVDDFYGIDTAYNDTNPMDDNSHGSHVAGTIGAVGNNNTGVVGVNWNVKIMSCKSFTSGGYGYTSDSIECLEYINDMKNRGVNIIATNNSWGGPSYSQALYDAINAQKDILFIASAGNDGTSNDYVPHYPSSYKLPNVISVAATDGQDNITYFSNYGIQDVHVGAPGYYILSTIPDNSYGRKSGTSMAAPHVTGIAALIKSQDKSRDWKSIKNLLLTGGKHLNSTAGSSLYPLSERTITGRRVDAYGSLTCSNNAVFEILEYPTNPVLNNESTLSAISIKCDSVSGPITVTTSGGEFINLYDDGVGPDLAPGDGIFSGKWTTTNTTDYLEFSSPLGLKNLSVATLQWIKSFDSGNKYYAKGIAVDGDNNIYVTGYSHNGSNYDILTIKYDSEGNILRTDVYDSGANDYSRGIKINSSGNVYINGGQNIIKYDLSGNMWWNKTLNVSAEDMAIDEFGNVYVIGKVYNGLSYDFPITKIDSAGSIVWTKNIAEGNGLFSISIAVDEFGNSVFVSARYRYTVNDLDASYFSIIKFDANGDELWKKQVRSGIKYMIVDKSGNLYTAGEEFRVSTVRKYQLNKYDFNGNLIWNVVHPSYRDAKIRGIALDKFGNLYATGFSNYTDKSNYDVYTVKYGSTGNFIWDMTYDEGSNDKFLGGVAVDGDENVYVAGTTNNNYSIKDYFTFKYKQPAESPNQRPIANAGPDQTITDNDKTGDETVTLDGSASYDPDGTLVSYQWEENGTVLGITDVLALTLSAGSHDISLIVTDDFGAVGTDSVKITINGVPDIGSLHVQSIELSGRKKGSRRSASAVVTVVDSSNTPIEGAMVYGSWSGAVSGDVNGITSGGKRRKGKVTFSSDSITSSGTFIFTVTDVVLPGGTYDPGANGETTDSVTVP